MTLTREEAIIKAYIAGKPVEPAQAVAKAGQAPDNSSAGDKSGLRRLLSSETMAELEKRKSRDEQRVARVQKTGEGESVEKAQEKVDREALRRDILGSDRLRKVKAATQYQSTAGSNRPYVRKGEGSFVPRHAR